MRTNPRTIRVPQEVLDEAVERVREYVLHLWETKKRNPRKKLREGFQLVYSPHPVDPSGKRVAIKVGVAVKDASAYGTARRYAVGDGKTRAVVKYIIRPTADLGTILGRSQEYNVRSTLHHELLHAMDPSPSRKRDAEEFGKHREAYYNDPRELRAHTREVVNEALLSAKYADPANRGDEFAQPLFYSALESSDRWERIQRFLTEENQRYVMSVVYREIVDAGYDPSALVI